MGSGLFSTGDHFETAYFSTRYVKDSVDFRFQGSIRSRWSGLNSIRVKSMSTCILRNWKFAFAIEKMFTGKFDGRSAVRWRAPDRSQVCRWKIRHCPISSYVNGERVVERVAPFGDPVACADPLITGSREALVERPNLVRDSVRVFQVRDSFLVLEENDGLRVIDQHALHEKILYEKILVAREQGTASSSSAISSPTSPSSSTVWR